MFGRKICSGAYKMFITKKIVKKYAEFRSWKTKQYLFVIESDDWGTERTKDREALVNLLKINNKVKNDSFSLLDTIATPDDLIFLFDVLKCVKDSLGNSPIITANFCTANPDFSKIKESGFSQFYYEPFYQTIERKERGAERLDLLGQGITERLFFPQLHGREHLHALAWLYELRLGNKELLKAFEWESWGIPYNPLWKSRRKNLLAALDLYGFDNESEFQRKWINESVNIFESYFKFKPSTFIPPAYTWHNQIAIDLLKEGIQGIQGIPLQYEPKKESSKMLYRRRLHINGQGVGNYRNIIRLTRSVFFEPFLNHSLDWKGIALSAIDNAFKNNLPAIMGIHRINFIGYFDNKHRDINLKNFKELLTLITKKWPKVKFITSDELTRIILSEIDSNS